MDTEKQKNLAVKYQDLFRLYLRSFRIENELSQDALAAKLGGSRAYVQKLESPSELSKPVNDIIGLQQFAELRGLSVDVFVAAITGITNESGEIAQIDRDLLVAFKRLSPTDRILILNIFKTLDPEDSGIQVLNSYTKSHDKKRDIFNAIVDLDDRSGEKRKMLIRLISKLDIKLVNSFYDFISGLIGERK